MDKDIDHNILISRIRENRQNRETVARELLSDLKLKNNIFKVVTSKGGNNQDAHSIFNYVIVSFFKKILMDQSFYLKGNIYSYLNGIAKYLWYAELRKKNIKTVSLDEIHYSKLSQDIHSGHDLLVLNKDKWMELNKLLDLIGGRCKEVLLHWSQGHTMKEISELLNFPSEGAVRKKKHGCLKKITDLLKQKPHLKKILQE